MKKRAFTLIELLVVISIIAILAGIALPVFQGVIERGKATQDSNNMRQLGTAMLAYLNDNGNQMFPGPAGPGGAGSWPATLFPNYNPAWKVLLLTL